MIGVFDSGYGGLTVLSELLKKLPEYNYVYLGDNARAPYGDKSQKAIYQLTREAVDFLVKKECKIIIVACNTASAGALRRLQREYLPKRHPKTKVLGVIRPVAEEIAERGKGKVIGVIGTRATVDSRVYQKEIKETGIRARVFQKACPLLVPLVEEGGKDEPEMKKILKKYLKPLQEKKIDILILGCTHYPVLLKEIKNILNKKTVILNSPAAVARKLDDYIKRHPEIRKRLSKNKIGKNKIKYYTTDDPEKFKKIGKRFLKRKIKKVEKAKL